MPDWVPQDDRVHFVIAAVEQMDLSMAEVNLRGSGSEQLLPLLEQQVQRFPPFPPARTGQSGNRMAPAVPRLQLQAAFQPDRKRFGNNHGIKSNQQGFSAQKIAIQLFTEELYAICRLPRPLKLPFSHFNPIPSRNSESKPERLRYQSGRHPFPERCSGRTECGPGSWAADRPLQAPRKRGSSF